MKRDQSSSEIIEVIDDDGDAFDRSTASHTVYDTGGHRWVGPVAAVVLVCVVGYGIVTSATSTDEPNAAATTTTVGAVADVTIPRPSVVPEVQPELPNVPYFAADPPRDFTVRYANVQQLDHAPFIGYGYQLWATPAASATTGSWVSVRTYLGGSTLNAPNSYRVHSGDLSIGISHSTSGHTLAQFSDGPVGVTLTAFGWSDDDLVRLAGSVRTDGRTIDFADSWFSADHQLVSTVQPWLAVQSIPAEQVSYASTGDPTAEVVITVGKRLQDYEGGTEADRETALRFLLDRNTPFEVDGLSAVAGMVVGNDGVALATWTTGDNIVTVSAPMPLPQLIAIARSVHEVAPTEWDGMKFQVLRNRLPETGGSVFPSQLPTISSGTDAESQPWSIDVVVSHGSPQQQINWQWDGNGFGYTADATPEINTVVDNQRTYVLADLPRDIAATAQLQITRTGLDPVVVDFTDADATIDRTFAAFAFSEPTTYTAQIIGPDGAVLATWPSA